MPAAHNIVLYTSLQSSTLVHRLHLKRYKNLFNLCQNFCLKIIPALTTICRFFSASIGHCSESVPVMAGTQRWALF